MESMSKALCLMMLFAFGLSLATEMDLTEENVRLLFGDFAEVLSNAQSNALEKDSRRRRNLLLLDNGFEVDPFLEDFDLEVALSDFLDGVLQTPVLDFFTASPQSQEQWEGILKEKYNDFCSDVQKERGRSLLESCTGLEITLELVPGICQVIDREHNKFDCQPPRLEYTRKGPVCTNSFREPAKFVDKECKFVQQVGVEKELILGGGSLDTLFTFGRQNTEITPEFDFEEFTDVIGGLFSDLTDFPDIPDLPFF
eukprot:g1942.t1